MKLSIVQFSEKKAEKAVLNSSRIEGCEVTHDRSIKIKTHRIVSKLCS